jgi:TatD family-associated radical SAM protein
VPEVVDALGQWDLERFPEVVFCGYGEPTERLDALLEVGSWLKAHHPSLPIRVNTNGLADLIAGRPTAASLAGIVDRLSISLNSADAKEYLELCRPRFGEAAYPAMLHFAQEASNYVPEVVMTIVGAPVTSEAEQSACRELCGRLGLRLRIRPYERIQ